MNNIHTALQALQDEVLASIRSFKFERAREVMNVLEQLTKLPAGANELTPDETATLRTSYIRCVKNVRDRTQMGLRESKEFVDTYIQVHGWERVMPPGATGGTYYRPTREE